MTSFDDRFKIIAMDRLFERAPELVFHSCLQIERDYGRGPTAVTVTCCQGQIDFYLTDIEFQCIQYDH